MIIFNPLEQIFDFTGEGASGTTGGPATEAPKLIEVFDTDVSTVAGDLLYLTAANFVSTVPDNSPSTIPNGIFGVCTGKESSTVARVTFIGIQGGYSGFTPGLPLFVDSLGEPTHTRPTIGPAIVQQIGFAVTSTSFFIYLNVPTEIT